MERLTRDQYPLGSKRPDLLKTPTGKTYEDLSLEAAVRGDVTAEDIRIGPETLQMHAAIAEDLGRTQLAQNFRRAAEMIAISDKRILEIYDALRPNRSTKEELLTIAEEMEQQYGAAENAILIREAAEIYARRGLLREPEEV